MARAVCYSQLNSTSDRWLSDLSGILAKSGPLDFATKNSLIFLYFLFVKRVWYTRIKTTLFIFQFFIFALLQASFARNGVSGGDQNAKIYGF